MKVRPSCAACILLSRARELERLGGLSLEDALAGFRVIAETTGAYLGPDIELSLLATISYRKLKSMLGSSDPYAALKEEGARKARESMKQIIKYLENLDDEKQRFLFAVKVAAAGNAADFARPHIDAYIHTFESIRRIDLKLNEMIELYDRIKRGDVSHIAYILDGAVEAYYDYVLVRVLKDMNVAISLIVKSDNFEDDATTADVANAGLTELADEVFETGSDAASIIPDETASEVLSALKEADVTIAKGPMNYIHIANNLDLVREAYGIMRVPCRFLARLLNASLGSYIAVKVRPLSY